MVTQLDGKTIIEPTLADAMTILKQDIFATLNCVKVGQIQSYNGTKKTAQVQILFKRVLPNTTIQDYPILLDVPVFTLQGGGAALQLPIAAGDQCILLFSDRNIDAWFKNGAAAAPFDARCHDMSDAIAIVGINSLASNLSENPTDAVHLSYSGANIELGSDGLISIANQTTDLLTLLNAFIDVLTALTVQDGSSTLPLTTAAIATLNAFKFQFAELLS